MEMIIKTLKAIYFLIFPLPLLMIGYFIGTIISLILFGYRRAEYDIKNYMKEDIEDDN